MMKSIFEFFSRYSIIETIQIFLVIYFLFIYAPIRFFMCSFLSKKFKEYLDIPCTLGPIKSITPAAILTASQHFGWFRNFFSSSYKKEMPIWLKRVGSIIFLMDMIALLFIALGLVGLFD